MPISRPKKTNLSLSYQPAFGRIRVGGKKSTPSGTTEKRIATQRRSDEKWARKKKLAWRKRKRELKAKICEEANIKAQNDLAESIVQSISL